MANRPIYVINPIVNNSNNSSKLLADLGKPTKRGIKKCSNCGTYNGTRGLICKNKECCTPFKEADYECKTSLDAVRLVTGNARRVYSVRVKERSPYCRGFVQLPFVQAKQVDNQNVTLCFVDSCQRLFDNSILKCHEKKQNELKYDSICPHIEAALKSVHVAKTFEIQKDILDRLKFPEDIKMKLLILANESDGTLVQQVSRSVMAVQCQVSSKHPLGYLHFMFLSSKGKETFDKYCCNCSQFRDHVCSKTSDPKCLHYYACIWAFASCSTLPEEFIPIVASEISNNLNEISMRIGLLSEGKYHSSHGNKRRLKSKVQEKSSSYLEGPFNKEYCSVDNHLSSSHTSLEVYPDDTMFNLDQQQNSNCDNSDSNKRLRLDEDNMEIPGDTPSINFIEWLSSVTERINHSLSKENLSNTYKTLEFQIAESFFESLRNRINRGSEISRQSFMSSIGCSENDNVQYLYNIFSAHHLKEIFDTPQVSLCLVKTIVLNKSSIVAYLQVDRQQQGSNSNTFSIEWNPNVLPTSKFGILRLKFKIGKFN